MVSLLGYVSWDGEPQEDDKRIGIEQSKRAGHEYMDLLVITRIHDVDAVKMKIDGSLQPHKCKELQKTVSTL